SLTLELGPYEAGWQEKAGHFGLALGVASVVIPEVDESLLHDGYVSELPMPVKDHERRAVATLGGDLWPPRGSDESSVQATLDQLGTTSGTHTRKMTEKEIEFCVNQSPDIERAGMSTED